MDDYYWINRISTMNTIARSNVESELEKRRFRFELKVGFSDYFIASGYIGNISMCVNFDYANTLIFFVSDYGRGSEYGVGFINEINPIVDGYGITPELHNNCLVLKNVPPSLYYPIIDAMLRDDMRMPEIKKPKKEKPPQKTKYFPTLYHEEYGKLHELAWDYIKYNIKSLFKISNIEEATTKELIETRRYMQSQLSELINGLATLDEIIGFFQKVIIWEIACERYWRQKHLLTLFRIRFSIPYAISHSNAFFVFMNGFRQNCSFEYNWLVKHTSMFEEFLRYEERLKKSKQSKHKTTIRRTYPYPDTTSFKTIWNEANIMYTGDPYIDQCLRDALSYERNDY